MRLSGRKALLCVLVVCGAVISRASAYFGDSSFESDVVEALMSSQESQDFSGDESELVAASTEEELGHRSLRPKNGRATQQQANLQQQLQQQQKDRKEQLQQLQEQQQAAVKCGWPLYITAKTYNLALPDTNAVYQAMVLDGITSKNIIHIRGQFPKVRYFSYQTYETTAGRPLGSMPDFKIVPETATVVNPFAQRPPASQPAPSAASNAWYNLYITPSGKMGFPNELPATNTSQGAASCDSGEPCKVAIFFRLYIGEADYDPYDHKADVSLTRWGYVLPPTITRETYQTPPQPTRLGLGATTVPAPLRQLMPNCAPGMQNAATKRLYKTQKDRMELSNAFNGSQIDNQNDNFILYTGRKYFTPYPNQDSQYLFSPANPTRIAPYVLFAEIGGRLPVVPGSLTTAPYIGEPRSYDVRFVSLSSMNPGAFQPVIDELMDKQIEDFYSTKPGGFGDRKFRILAGPDTVMANKCGLYDSKTTIFLRTEASASDKQLEKALQTAPELLAFVYRQVLSREEVTGIPDRSVNSARKLCQGMGPSACFNKDIYRRVMGDTYPNVTYYACDPNTGKVVDMKTAMAGFGAVGGGQQGKAQANIKMMQATEKMEEEEEDEEDEEVPEWPEGDECHGCAECCNCEPPEPCDGCDVCDECCAEYEDCECPNGAEECEECACEGDECDDEDEEEEAAPAGTTPKRRKRRKLKKAKLPATSRPINVLQAATTVPAATAPAAEEDDDDEDEEVPEWPEGDECHGCAECCNCEPPEPCDGCDVCDECCAEYEDCECPNGAEDCEECACEGDECDDEDEEEEETPAGTAPKRRKLRKLKNKNKLTTTSSRPINTLQAAAASTAPAAAAAEEEDEEDEEVPEWPEGDECHGCAECCNCEPPEPCDGCDVCDECCAEYEDCECPNGAEECEECACEGDECDDEDEEETPAGAAPKRRKRRKLKKNRKRKPKKEAAQQQEVKVQPNGRMGWW